MLETPTWRRIIDVFLLCLVLFLEFIPPLSVSAVRFRAFLSFPREDYPFIFL